MKYCNSCGGPLVVAIPPGDDRPRHVCQACGAIHYQNPKMVVGCIVEHGDRILLCRRAIDPQYGKWTIPAGFLENGETVTQGARRETREEASAELGELTPYRLYNLTPIGQMYLIFRAQLSGSDFAAGKESLDVRLFTRDAIPWDEIAFKVVTTCLESFFQDRESGEYSFGIGEIHTEPR